MTKKDKAIIGGGTATTALGSAVALGGESLHELTLVFLHKIYHRLNFPFVLVTASQIPFKEGVAALAVGAYAFVASNGSLAVLFFLFLVGRFG